MRGVSSLQTSKSPPADQDPVPRTSAKLQIGSRPARILIVDADRSTWTLQRRLESFGAQVQTLDSSSEVLTTARAYVPDVLLLDVAMPGADGIRLIRELKKDGLTQSIPVIVVSAADGVDIKVQNLGAGACDYVVKPFSVAELIARIRVVVRMKSRDDFLRRRLSFVEELAASDPLTSLLNRRAFDERLLLEMEHARQSRQPLSCLILDIDWFKSINDRYGHRVGDDVLRQIAKIILERRRERDAVCRYGGEEFVWLLPGMGRQILLEWAEWLRRTIEETEIPTAEGAFQVSVSVGVSTYQWKEHGVLSAQLLFEQADSALLEAKKQGKNRVIFREPVLPGSPGDERSVRLSSDGSPPTRAGEVVSGTDGGRQPALAAELAGAVDGDEFQQAMRDLLESSVQVLIAALEAKDSETMAHSQRVSSTAVAISMEMGLPAEEIERIKLASLLHDLGKLAVPEAVLRKPGPLNAEEWEILRKHPERGAAMLQGAKSFRHLVELVRFHQESFDGTGYPDRLIGNKIPLGARIIRVADAFDALTHDRPYRPRKSLDGARVELRQMAGSVLDPEIVESFLRMLATMSPLDIYLTLWREGNSDGTLDTGYGDPQTAPNAYDIGRLSGDPGPLRVSFGTHSAESSE